MGHGYTPLFFGIYLSSVLGRQAGLREQANPQGGDYSSWKS